jgi:hypothetical protein
MRQLLAEVFFLLLPNDPLHFSALKKMTKPNRKQKTARK